MEVRPNYLFVPEIKLCEFGSLQEILNTKSKRGKIGHSHSGLVIG